MVARHYYRFDPEEDTEEVPNVLRWGYTAASQAEEGQAPLYEVVVDDPEMTMDFVGHRRWTFYEDESEDGNEILVDGLTQAVRIAHTGADITNPVGRVWTIEIADLNTLWQYRVMTGSDSQFAEQTDVERMQQLVDSEEMSYFDDFTLLSTDAPVTLDKLNARGQTPAQVADTCGQETGKNWYIYSTGTRGEVGADIGIWYGRDSLTAYQSPLSLSNAPADLDMAAVNATTATTYPIGADTVLRRDYQRQYSGAYGEFEGGAKYVVNTATLSEITLSGRDMVHPAPEIKSRARMERRLTRQLADHADPDHVVSMTITLPANKVVQCRAGMRIFVTMTHEPGYEAGRYLRILSAKYTPVGNWYSVGLEMQGPGAAAAAPTSCSTLIAGTEQAHASGHSTTPSVGITPTFDGLLLAFLVGVNSNTPQALNMTIPSGYTSVDTIADAHKSTWRVAAKAAAAGVASTATASFTAGFGGHDGWIAHQVALATASLSPVQQKSNANVSAVGLVVLDSLPTVGNMIVMWCMAEDVPTCVFTPGVGGGPTDGWVQVGDAVNLTTNGEYLAAAAFARCVNDADDITEYLGAYGFGVSSPTASTSIWVGEFEVTS